MRLDFNQVKKIHRINYFMGFQTKKIVKYSFLVIPISPKTMLSVDTTKTKFSVVLRYQHLMETLRVCSQTSVLLQTEFPWAMWIHHSFVICGENKVIHQK